MVVIGLTGNIGCGKSSVSNIFIKNNIPVIDADKVSREIMNDEKVIKEVIDYFGEIILTNDNSIDRKKLGSIVFGDDDKLIRLNSITHPNIKFNILNQINNYKNENIVIVDAALLIEAKFEDLVKKIVLITCDEEIQIQRIITRDNLSEEEALKRIKSQMNQNEKKKYCDYIIDNSNTLDELVQKTNELLVYIKENWCE